MLTDSVLLQDYSISLTGALMKVISIQTKRLDGINIYENNVNKETRE